MAQVSMVACRLIPETTAFLQPAPLPRQPPRPRSTAPLQSTPKTPVRRHVAPLSAVLATSIHLVLLDPGVVTEPSLQLSQQLLRRPVESTQFTSMAFTAVLQREKIAISMDGRGAWRDNVVVERLWRSVKYEEVYLRAYGSVSEARASIGRYLDFYNGRRPHSSLDRRTPDHVYFNRPLLAAA
jgi:hypothetical protein